MEVKINIESSQIGETVIDLFRNLSEEQKQSVASQALLEWLREPYDVERSAFEEKLTEKLQKKYPSKSIKEIRDVWEYSQQMRDFKSSREEMVMEIKESTKEFFKKEVKNYIESDEQILQLRYDILKQVKETYPQIMHDAMVMSFAQNMEKLNRSVIENAAQINQINYRVDQTERRLNT